MKVLILDTYYQNFLTEFYHNFPEVDSFSYEKTKEKIMGQLFGTADFYSKNLKLLGYQAEDMILNDKILQKKWAKENSVVRLFDWADGIHIPFTKIGFHSNWQNEILKQQMLRYRPNVIYCQNLFVPDVNFFKQIKKEIKVKVVGQVASPVSFDKKTFVPFDLILTSFPHFVSKFRKLGINSEYFKIGFEETVLTKLRKNKRQYPITFVGGFSRHHNNEIVADVATDIWGYGRVPQNKKYHGEAWGVDMYNILYNSKITLNRHIDVAENHANNMRLYEATGVGTMLITDYKSDLEKLFIPGKEVETYKTQEELLDKVRYYLGHDKERERIAKAGQKRTIRDHTYKKRMEELVKIFQCYNFLHG